MQCYTPFKHLIQIKSLTNIWAFKEFVSEYSNDAYIQAVSYLNILFQQNRSIYFTSTKIWHNKNQYLSVEHNYVFGNQEISHMFWLKIKPASVCVQRLESYNFKTVINNIQVVISISLV
jgi:hypothetical protein